MRIKESIQLLYPNISVTFPISVPRADILVICRVLDLEELSCIAINAATLQRVKEKLKLNEL